MKSNYVSKLQVSALVLVTAFSFSAVSSGEGTHGGDGRMLHNKVYASVSFLENMQNSLKNFLTTLRAKKRQLDSGWENSEFAILISDELLNDVYRTPPYELKRRRGACGYLADGFPRTASTQLGVPNAPICVDVMTAQDLGLTASQLAGIIVHEHIRHLPKNLGVGYAGTKTTIDTFHNYASVVAAIYWDVQTDSGKGACTFVKSGGVGRYKSTELAFDTAELLLSGPVSGSFDGMPVSIAAKFVKDQYGKESVEVTVSHNIRRVVRKLPIRRTGSGTVFWRQADFDFNDMPFHKSNLIGRETSVVCSTYTRNNPRYLGERTSTAMERDWNLKTNPETNEIEFSGRSNVGSDQ